MAGPRSGEPGWWWLGLAAGQPDGRCLIFVCCVAGEVDDRGEEGRHCRAGADQFAERAFLVGQVLADAVTDLGQQLVQAAEHLLTVIGQVSPGKQLISIKRSYQQELGP